MDTAPACSRVQQESHVNPENWLQQLAHEMFGRHFCTVQTRSVRASRQRAGEATMHSIVPRHQSGWASQDETVHTVYLWSLMADGSFSTCDCCVLHTPVVSARRSSRTGIKSTDALIIHLSRNSEGNCAHVAAGPLRRLHRLCPEARSPSSPKLPSM